jgi:hypothetical protein
MLSYGLISEGIPERLHPKSFRSTFEVNTHVWATKQQRYVPYVKVRCQRLVGVPSLLTWETGSNVLARPPHVQGATTAHNRSSTRIMRQ